MDKKYHIYKVVAINGDKLSCRPYRLEAYSVTGLRVPWSEIGVFRKGPLDEDGEPFDVYRSEVDGKVVDAGGVLATFARNVLLDR